MIKKLLGLSVLKLGNHKNGRRVWIANSKLAQSFNIGDSLLLDYDSVKRRITIDKAELLGNHSVSSRNKKDVIIDIKNQLVETTLGINVGKVEVLFYKNRVVVRVSRKDIEISNRENKTTGKMFEFFSSAGTLSHFMRKYGGYKPTGILEMENDLVKMYEKNHGDDVFTIVSRLEDIHPDEFKKFRDIELILAGIPCNSISNSNIQNQKNMKKEREGKIFNSELMENRYQAEALTYYLLSAIKIMNPKKIVIEEVEAFSKTSASNMLRTVLKMEGYNISETVGKGSHNKRKRWCLIANHGPQIPLSKIDFVNDGLSINDLLETSVKDREWFNKKEMKRISRAEKTVGIRSVKPDDIMSNTFTCHSTRSTEPVLQHPDDSDLYSEFTNQEIANIHGLGDFILSGIKTIDRRILGQGVTDFFKPIAEMIKTIG